MGTVPVFASATEAMQMVRAGLDYLAATDATAMPAEEQARCLRGLEQVNSVATAARTSILGAYTAGQGYAADADYSPRAWLIHKTGVTRGAAVTYTAWVRRSEAHPRVAEALAAGEISESVARTLCLWTDKLPEDRREEADKILSDAAVSGLGLADLAGLFAEIYERYRSEEPDEDKEESFEDRALRLVTTLGGAGVLHGDLTPECAAAVQAVLDALSAPADAEDTRTREQRCHDALRRGDAQAGGGGHAAGAGRAAGESLGAHPAGRAAGHGRQHDPGQAVGHRDAGRVGRAPRPAASEGGGDIGAWLNGDAAKAVACDAAMAPVVTGEVNPAALEDLVRLCVQLHKLRHGTPDGDGTDDTAGAGAPADTSPAWEAIEQAVIGKAVDLVSGPGGLASFLRRRQLGARLGGPSLPLDIGYAETVPAGIRNAVILRDKHCRWAGGCNQPAAACEVHHVTHKANGGKTSTKDCLLLCFFHHQVVIHRWGWTLVLNPDGTTTAWNKDKTKVLHSHGPPDRAG